MTILGIILAVFSVTIGLLVVLFSVLMWIMNGGMGYGKGRADALMFGNIAVVAVYFIWWLWHPYPAWFQLVSSFVFITTCIGGYVYIIRLVQKAIGEIPRKKATSKSDVPT